MIDPASAQQHKDSEKAAGTDLLARALDNLAEGAVVIGAAGQVVHVNRAAAVLLSVEQQAAVGQRCSSLLGCEAQGQSCPAFGHLVGQPPGASYTSESCGLRRTVTLVRAEDGSPAAMVALLQPADTERAGSQPPDDFSLRDLVGRSESIRRIADTIRRLANSDVPVLVTGESGTGKELIARALHGSSRRRAHAFVAVNCGAIPLELAESELFGHVRGAFTGAMRDRKGAVQEAEGGTFLLDEVGDLPLVLQPKLLRLLQEKTYQAVGDPRTRRADIRVVAATNVDLEQAVEAGSFRSDLYYRLRVVPIHVPPLRQRAEDIGPLASILLARRSVAAGRIPMRLSSQAMLALQKHSWPGNVRELLNVLDYVVALCPGDVVEPEHLPPDLAEQPSGRQPVRGRYAAGLGPQQEAEQLLAALRRNNFHRQRTARELGMDRVTLYRKIKEYGLLVPPERGE
jgi:transcriptional regulator with PAS, ATPase and Fis domain